ncbi:MAG TPA: hypothetical protein VK038_11035 [Ornithinicoccus sp.]|nr:hypothetical protein [Ornithinicoccus sp.]
MTPPSQSTLSFHAGDVPFTLTGPADWLTDQQRHLHDCIPASTPTASLPGVELDVYLSQGYFNTITQVVNEAPGRDLEPVPGVVLREARPEPGQRWYAIASDDVDHRPGAYAVRVTGRHIDLVVPPGQPEHRYPIRLVREAMIRTHEDAGGTLFHAAGIDLAGTGVMVTGPRGAGKTTMTAALLSQPGTSLLSNDRLIAAPDGQLLAVPLPVPTGRGTIEAFDPLTAAVHGKAATLPPEFGSRIKHVFTARQFATAFDATLTDRTRPGLIVVPNLTDTTDPVATRSLDPDQARTLLAENCFTPRDEFWRPWLLPRHTSDADLTAQATATIDRLTSLPCVQVSFGVRNPTSDLTAALADLTGVVR